MIRHTEDCLRASADWIILEQCGDCGFTMCRECHYCLCATTDAWICYECNYVVYDDDNPKPESVDFHSGCGSELTIG